MTASLCHNSSAHLCATSVEQIGNKGTGNTETEEQLITGQNGTPEILDIRKEIKKYQGEEKDKNKTVGGGGGKTC